MLGASGVADAGQHIGNGVGDLHVVYPPVFRVTGLRRCTYRGPAPIPDWPQPFCTSKETRSTPLPRFLKEPRKLRIRSFLFPFQNEPASPGFVLMGGGCGNSLPAVSSQARKQRFAPSESPRRKTASGKGVPICARARKGSGCLSLSICQTGVIGSRRTFNILQDRHRNVNPFFGVAPIFFGIFCEDFTNFRIRSGLPHRGGLCPPGGETGPVWTASGESAFLRICRRSVVSIAFAAEAARRVILSGAKRSRRIFGVTRIKLIRHP